MTWQKEDERLNDSLFKNRSNSTISSFELISKFWLKTLDLNPYECNLIFPFKLKVFGALCCI